jgi:NADPH:quinone reductase-like Zn-dependent oxidoreductase
MPSITGGLRMRAVVLHELGPAENLHLEDVPDPQPKPGEVVVRLKSAALNHRDVWIRKGLYAGIKLPIILGSDGAGTVAAIGVGVDPSLMGKDVVINPGFDWGEDERVQSPYFRILGLPDDGTYAELVKAPATNVHRKPESWSWEEAAALPLAALTAYRAVVTRAQVREGEHVLVTGIGGGVSIAALQIAKASGARVVVTSGSDAKLERAKTLGAIGGVNYKLSDWSKTVSALTAGGPDVVIDSVGGETLAKAIDIVKPGGRIVTYGATTGPVPQLEVRRIFWKQLALMGSTMGTPREFAAMLELYSTSNSRPVVDRAFPLAEAPAAHTRMEQAGQFGKIVLTIN